MPGPRQKLSVLEANGRKHLSRTEKAERAAQEVNLPKPKTLRPPKWLPDDLKPEFRALAREILAADIGAAQLDCDTLGRYVVAQRQFAAACREAQRAMESPHNTEAAAEWLKMQDTCFKQCRACANDMGMTITSRCRLVIPDTGQKKEENPFERLIREREQRA